MVWPWQVFGRPASLRFGMFGGGSAGKAAEGAAKACELVDG